MSGIPENRWSNLAFSSTFNYLHVVASGQVTLDDQGSDNSTSIPLPAGLTTPFIRVFAKSWWNPSYLVPVMGFYSSGASAQVQDGNLVISMQHAQAQGNPNFTTFYYFIYGGNYS